MRDLDSELTGLRNTLRDSIHPPATEEAVRRGRRRMRRQQAQVAAVVAIVVAAGAWPFLRIPDSAAPASPERSRVVAHDYFDVRNGFALGEVCQAGHECDPWFMTTSNGQTWEKRDVPPIEAGRVIALGTSKVVVEDHPAVDSSNRYYSNNGGHTWSAVTARADTTIEEIPEDAALETTTTPETTDLCRNGSVIVLLSDSGRSAKLANQPPIDLTWCQSYPDLNGTRWVAGSDPRTRQPVVASTRNRGRSWQITPLPAFTSPPASRIGPYYPRVTMVSTPAASYASVINPAISELVAIFRSSDLGVTWTRTWQASAGTQPTQVLGTPIAGTDGKIRIPQSGNVWTSTDGGTSFKAEPARDGAMTGAVQWIRAGYLSSSGESASTGHYSLSYDGVSWQKMEIPLPE
ncbi:MAG: hypothetical protein ABW224_00895 [Kibdelosporangium sp.]